MCIHRSQTFVDLSETDRYGAPFAAYRDASVAAARIGKRSGFTFLGGAASVYTRSGGVWTQQGPKLVGTGATGSCYTDQGRAVALSADGNTALISGPCNEAVWVWTRTAGVWTQQGPKLVGT